jgi:hypothetical protein
VPFIVTNLSLSMTSSLSSVPYVSSFVLISLLGSFDPSAFLSAWSAFTIECYLYSLLPALLTIELELVQRYSSIPFQRSSARSLSFSARPRLTMALMRTSDVSLSAGALPSSLLLAMTRCDDILR